ncbi:hypothetical protein ACS0TY_002915 [Phlomoides rotata]
MDKSGRARGYRLHDDELGMGLSSRTLLIIKLPDSRSLRIVSRSLFLAMLLLALPSLASIIRAFDNQDPYADSGISTDEFKILLIILRDLLDDGLLKRGHKGFLLGAAIEDDLELLRRNNGIELLTGADLSDHHQVVDYVYAPSFPRGIHLVDGILKQGGLVISPLGLDPSYDLRMLKNFKIVYLRRFEITVAAMRKMEEESSNSLENSSANEVYCGITPEKKKAALKGLEEVYLEPPNRAAMAKRSSFVKFLPDLLKESLDEYPRRVFITDESRALDWFYNNYPVRNQEFEVYDMEVNDKSVSDLMRKINLRPEDYVVIKAEAQVVEQMMRNGTMCLVDELFMECRNEEGKMRKKRAYWQCLALYGRVRVEGIAVHQWWY